MSQSTSLGALFGNAADDGNVSQSTLQALQVEDLGEQIQNAMGVQVDDVSASEVVLVTIMPDDSGSIRFANNSQVVRDGHNQVLEALAATKQTDGILVHTRYLNGHVLYPYCTIDQAVRMDSGNYNPNLGTPLYDQTATVLATVLVKAQEFEDNGVPCKTVTLLITDGEDVHSRRQTASTNKSLVCDMLKSENHIIAAMGIPDPQDPQTTERFFRGIFREMGILDEWILTPGSSDSELRAAFQLFSQSAVRASQGGASFSQTAVGGFGG